MALASFFDPLGLYNPIIVRLKILFQDISMGNACWDAPLDSEHIEKWLAIVSDLKSVDFVSQPRKYCFQGYY